MNIDTFLHSELLQRIAWGLLHSIWQIGLLAVIYALVALLLTARHARIRYLFGFATLLTMTAIPVVTMFLLEPVSVVTSSKHREMSVPVNEIPANIADPVHLADLFEKPRKTIPVFRLEGIEEAGEVEDIGENTETAVAAVPASVEPSKPVQRDVDWLRFFPLLTGIWFLGVLVMFLRLCFELLAIRRLKKHAFVIADGIWEETLRNIADRFKIRRKILVRGSKRIGSPLLVGAVRPMVLIPLSMVSSLAPEQIEVILTHELTHLKRHDYLANLVQILIETLLFYHPLLWWVSHAVRRDREYLCDDIVVSQGGIDTMLYAQTLTCLEQIRKKEGQTMKRLTTAPAAAAKPLLNRVKRLMKMKTHPERRSDCLVGAIVLLILAAFPLSALFWGTAGAPQNVSAQHDALFPPTDAPMQPVPAKTQPQTLQIYNDIWLDEFDPESLKAFLENYLKSVAADAPAASVLVSMANDKGQYIAVLATEKQHGALREFTHRLITMRDAAAHVPEVISESVALQKSRKPEPEASAMALIPVEDIPNFDDQPIGIPAAEGKSLPPIPMTEPEGQSKGNSTLPNLPRTIAIRFTQEDPREFERLCQSFYHIMHTHMRSNSPQQPWTIQHDETSGILIVAGDEDFINTIRRTAQNYDSKITLRHDSLDKFSSQKESVVNTKQFTLKHSSAAKFCHFLRSVYMPFSDSTEAQVGRDVIRQTILDGPITFFADEKTNRLTVAWALEDDGSNKNEITLIHNFIKICDLTESGVAPLQAQSEESKVQDDALAVPLESFGNQPTINLNSSGVATIPAPPAAPKVTYITMKNGDTAAEFYELLVATFFEGRSGDHVFHEPPSRQIVIVRTSDEIELIEKIAKRYDQEEMSYPYKSFADYIAQNGSAKTMTVKLNHRAGEPFCRFFRAALESQRTTGSTAEPYVFFEPQGNLLIFAGTDESHFGSQDEIQEMLNRYDRPQETQNAERKMQNDVANALEGFSAATQNFDFAAYIGELPFESQPEPAPEPVAEPTPEPAVEPTAMEATEKLLRQKVSYRFEDEPLSGIVEKITTDHGIGNILIDAIALEEEGVSPDMAITLTVNDLSLAKTFHLILEMHALTYYIDEEGVIVITTKTIAAEKLELRVYNIGPDSRSGNTLILLLEVLDESLLKNARSFNAEVTSYPIDENTFAVNAPYQTHRKIKEFLNQMKTNMEK